MTATTTLARALFASDLATGSRPTKTQVTAAVRRTVRRCGGPAGCLAELAGAYGEYPETAATRMRWARYVADDFIDQKGN